MRDGELKYFQEVIAEIGEALEELSGPYVAQLYNEVCGKTIKYEGDSLFTVYTG